MNFFGPGFDSRRLHIFLAYSSVTDGDRSLENVCTCRPRKGATSWRQVPPFDGRERTHVRRSSESEQSPKRSEGDSRRPTKFDLPLRQKFLTPKKMKQSAKHVPNLLGATQGGPAGKRSRVPSVAPTIKLYVCRSHAGASCFPFSHRISVPSNRRHSSRRCALFSSSLKTWSLT